MIDEHMHTFHGVHVSTGVNIYGTRPLLGKSMYGDMRFRQSVYNRNSLRVELMRKSIKDRRSTDLDRFVESGADSIKIIQQIECDAIEAN